MGNLLKNPIEYLAQPSALSRRSVLQVFGLGFDSRTSRLQTFYEPAPECHGFSGAPTLVQVFSSWSTAKLVSIRKATHLQDADWASDGRAIACSYRHSFSNPTYKVSSK
jgi:hypothetical protein